MWVYGGLGGGCCSGTGFIPVLLLLSNRNPNTSPPSVEGCQQLQQEPCREYWISFTSSPATWIPIHKLGTIKNERLRLPAVNNNANPIQAAAWLRFEITGSALPWFQRILDMNLVYAQYGITSSRQMLDFQTSSQDSPDNPTANLMQSFSRNQGVGWKQRGVFAGEMVPFGVSSPSERLEQEGTMDGTHQLSPSRFLATWVSLG